MKLALVLLTCISLHAAALSPEQERASFHLADQSLAVDLIASEPNVISPVAIAWDARGRLFVAEMIDYPLGPGSGQVRMLEDLDGDGVYEKSVIFADNLPFPNGVLPWRDGLLVTSAPNILFLRDTDGDGRADERRVVLTGFAEGNQQLRVNGLFLGLDGWVYGANGRSDGELHRPGEERGVSLRGHDFRFKPDTGEFEAIAGRSQFGLGHDDWGNRFLSWNTIAIRHEVIPENLLARNPYIPLTEAVHDLAPEGDTGEVFPLTPTPQTFNNESTSHFNALAGLTLYRGDVLPPPQYYGNAFMGETLRNLVHRRVLEPAGPTFLARRVEQGKEFLASTDPWFHPVNFATGPDGALYIVDFYRQWVEHPGYVPEKLRDKYAWRTGAEHGRIWRVRPRDWKRPSTFPQDFASSSLLDHPNGWVRDTAFRSLLHRHDESIVPELRRMAQRDIPKDSPRVYGTILALHLLSHLDGLDGPTIDSAVRNEQARIREVASRLGFPHPLTEDTDPTVRLWAVLSASSNEITAPSLVHLATRADLDHTMALAIRSRAMNLSEQLIRTIQQMRPPSQPALLELIQGLAEDSAYPPKLNSAGETPNVIRARAASIAAVPDPSEIDLAAFAGFARVAQNVDHELASPSTVKKFGLLAQKTATDPDASEIARACAFKVLAYLGRAQSPPTILEFLLTSHPEIQQRAAAKAIVESTQPALLAAALKSWDRYQISIRRQLLPGAARSAETATALIDELKAGRISPAEIDPFLRQTLLRTASKESKASLQELLGPPVSTNRAAIIEKFSAAVQLPGDKTHGRQLFEKSCAQCHTYAGFTGNVGPNLSGIHARPKEALLVDILDPSRQLPPEFLSYTVQLSDGEPVTGLLIAENPGSVTVRRPNLPDETIPRARITSIQAGKLSLMPDGLDAGMGVQDMADLLQFLTAP